MILVIVGPTAVGKSALAMELAERLGGEIVNGDSMQVYRGMDIGTAKATLAERQRVRHQLLDCWPIGHPASVAEFQRAARQAIAEVTGRGRVAILVGGSGLYVDAVTDDLRFPGTDPAIRARWEQRLEAEGVAALHAELQRRDPAAAAAIEPSNGRRIVRALEVNELTGGPFTAQLPGTRRSVLAHHRIGLRLDRPELDRRIAERVDRMWRDGLVAEVATLAAEGLADTPTASRALGYAQVLELLAGRIDEATAREQTITATRRFARRQESWFRRDPRVRWHEADRPALVDEVVAALGEPPTLGG